MNEEVYLYLKSQPKLINFVRNNPVWYRYLTREPNRINELEQASKAFYGKTFTQRLNHLSSQMQMVHMLIKFTGIIKD